MPRGVARRVEWRARAAAPGALLAMLAALVGSGCGPIVIEREGRRVFNPEYRLLLESPERDLWQKPAAMLEASGVGPGSVVADIGAGTGYLTRAFSRAVGPEGRVYATDVQPEMLAELERVALDHTNVEVVRGSFERPELPEACCDVAFFLNVYKEIEPRVPFLQETMRSLGEGGRVVIVGFEPDSRGPGPPKDMRLSAEEVIAECERRG